MSDAANHGDGDQSKGSVAGSGGQDDSTDAVTADVSPAAVYSLLGSSMAAMRRQFQRQHARSTLPSLPAPDETQPGLPDVVVRDLTASGAWAWLHTTFTRDRFDNLRPWFRCLGILQGHNAKTVIIERLYVCLDHRSEFASFYAHVDEERPHTTVRLHFFSDVVREDQLTDLSPFESGYLGYMVCRRGQLPLVGRTLLRKPSYVAEVAEVTESVNLLGQKLSVAGAPFMQQDQSFAVCADVTVWGIHYTAHRRGLAERRLIADIVELSGQVHPLRPRTSAGLTAEQAAELLGGLGFRSTVIRCPIPYNPSTLPTLILEEVPAALRQVLASCLGEATLDRRNDQISLALDDVFHAHVLAIDDPAADADAPAAPTELPDDVVEEAPVMSAIELMRFDDTALLAVDAYVDYLLAPYIRSRFPVYLSTASHTLTLVGRSDADDGVRLYVHDDQNGPYLELWSMLAVSGSDLARQSGLPNGRDGRTAEARGEPPPPDVLHGDYAPADRNDDPMQIEHIVVPTPARVTLSIWEAAAEALKWMNALRELLSLDALIAEARKRSPDPETFKPDEHLLEELRQLDSQAEKLLGDDVQVRSTMHMGIDYKSERRRNAEVQKDDVGARTFSSMNLAEWVIVVEGIQGQQVRWEIVFDATSSGPTPRVQLVRTQSGGFVTRQGHTPPFGPAPFGAEHYPPIKVKSAVGKVGTPDVNEGP